MGLALSLVCGLFVGMATQWAIDRSRMRELAKELRTAEDSIRYGCRFNIGPSVRSGVLAVARVGRSLRVWQ